MVSPVIIRVAQVGAPIVGRALIRWGLKKVFEGDNEANSHEEPLMPYVDAQEMLSSAHEERPSESELTWTCADLNSLSNEEFYSAIPRVFKQSFRESLENDRLTPMIRGGITSDFMCVIDGIVSYLHIRRFDPRLNAGDFNAMIAELRSIQDKHGMGPGLTIIATEEDVPYHSQVQYLSEYGVLVSDNLDIRCEFTEYNYTSHTHKKLNEFL
jgi:hypothetical protein